MLDVGDPANDFDQLWSSLPQRAALTQEMRGEQARRGLTPAAPGDRRRHPRFYFWRRAILVRGADRTYAAFTMNLSKSGLRVLSPEQIFPCERVQLILEMDKEFALEIRRCRRLAENCYECGAKFVARD
jgi:hypothetical protein